MTASNPAERITELTNLITAYGNEQTAATELKVKNDCADNAQKLTEEKNYQSGGAVSAGNPNPFNPPGQSSRK